MPALRVRGILPRTPRFARGLIHVTAAAARLVATAAARHDEAATPKGGPTSPEGGSTSLDEMAIGA